MKKICNDNTGSQSMTHFQEKQPSEGVLTAFLIEQLRWLLLFQWKLTSKTEQQNYHNKQFKVIDTLIITEMKGRNATTLLIFTKNIMFDKYLTLAF